MLSTSQRYTAAILLITNFTACSSKKKEDPAPAPGMTWTVDGSAVTTTKLQSQQYGGTISVAGTVLVGANPPYLSLEFPNAIGTYPFGAATLASASYTAPGNAQTVYYSGSTGNGTVTGAGTIVVTALSATNVQGTFTFTGINANSGASKSITNGTFNVGL